MSNFTIMRNGLNTEIVGDPHIGQSSEDVTVEVKDDGTYSGYAKRLYYSYCYHNELHRALSAVNSNSEYIIPVQAFFEPGMVKLTVELSNGSNCPACNACFLIVTDGAKDVDANVLPSEKTWQSYIQSYLNNSLSDIVHKPTVDALEKRIDNLILSKGSDSSSEVIDARTGYDGTAYDTLGTAIRSQANNLNNEIAENLEMFTTGKNLINSDTFSALGEWCNYSNGNIGTSKYVTTYRHSGYIPVKPNTTYSRRYNTGPSGTVFFDSKKNFISGVQTDIFTTPENCKFLIYNTDSVREHDYHECVLIEGNEIINTNEHIYPTPVFYNDFVKPNPDYVKKADLKTVVTVGTNDADFEKVGDAFAYAREHDLEVLIMPGEYDLVAEGISGNGYILPKKVTGYNATLKCHLPNENWDLSPLNTDYRYGAFEVYGLTVDIKNCRYCIHDEMGARTNETYKNVFKDLHLINRSNASDVLIAPNNIGGGCGNGGYIEITNCVMEQLGGHTKNIDYHSSFTGNQTGEAIIKMTGCCLDKKVTVSSIGSARENHNKMYVSNCKISTLPTDEAGNNFDIITWNNAQ